MNYVLLRNDFLHRLTHKIRTEKGEMSLSYLVAIDAKTLVSQKDIVLKTLCSLDLQLRSLRFAQVLNSL